MSVRHQQPMMRYSKFKDANVTVVKYGISMLKLNRARIELDKNLLNLSTTVRLDYSWSDLGRDYLLQASRYSTFEDTNVKKSH